MDVLTDVQMLIQTDAVQTDSQTYLDAWQPLHMPANYTSNEPKYVGNFESSLVDAKLPMLKKA